MKWRTKHQIISFHDKTNCDVEMHNHYMNLLSHSLYTSYLKPAPGCRSPNQLLRVYFYQFIVIFKPKDGAHSPLARGKANSLMFDMTCLCPSFDRQSPLSFHHFNSTNAGKDFNCSLLWLSTIVTTLQYCNFWPIIASSKSRTTKSPGRKDPTNV